MACILQFWSVSQSVFYQPTYNKEPYSLVQDVNNQKHYQIEKNKVIHIENQPL